MALIDLTDTGWWWLGYAVLFVFIVGLGVTIDWIVKIIFAFIYAVHEELEEKRAENSHRNKRY